MKLKHKHKRQDDKLKIQNRIKQLKKEGFILTDRDRTIEGNFSYILKREHDYLEIITEQDGTILDERVI